MILHSTAAKVARLIGGELIGRDIEIHGHLSTDTRTLCAGDVFIALTGEQFDGHAFLSIAASKSAALAIVSRYIENAQIPQILVTDALLAYGQLAGYLRSHFDGVVVGITGSSGKTSCKGMLASILAVVGNVHATAANFNNEVGVPLTLASINAQDDFAVIEMGAGKPGDISYLVQFAQPNIALVTNVGAAHLGLFDSVEHIAETKYQLYSPTSQLTAAVVNGDDEMTARWIENLRARELSVLSFGLQANNDIYAEDVSPTIEGSRFTLCSPHGRVEVALNVPGMHMVKNACAVAAVALLAGASLADIAKGLSLYVSEKGRLVTHVWSGISVMDDTYNANPHSMCAAIDTLSLAKGRRVLVAGDMAELGLESERLHMMVGEHAKNKVDAWYSTGNMMAFAAQAFGDAAEHFDDVPSLNAALCSSLLAGDTVLIKGSRSSRMERVVVALEQYFSGEAN